MKKLISTAFLCFIYCSSFSQTQSPKGFVILNNDQRVDGFLFLKPENKNPAKIRFSRDPSAKQAVTYVISDLKSFEIIDVDRFVRANVLTDIRPFNSAIQLPAKLDSFRAETVWLRELTTGKHISLYEFFDSRPHYFITDSTGEFKELRYKIGRENDRAYEVKLYIIQLQQYQEKLDPQSTTSFVKTKYTQYDLVKAVSSINGNLITENAALKRDIKVHYSVFAGAGIGMVTTKLSGVYESTGNIDFENNLFPFGVAGIDFYPGRKPGRATIRLDFTYNSANHKGKGPHFLYGNVGYELKQTNISPSVAGLFNFWNQQHLKLYFGPSVSYNVSSYEKNEYFVYDLNEGRSDNFIRMRKSWLSIDLRAGAKINNALEIVLRGQLAGKFERDPNYNLKGRQYLLGVAYHFLRK